MSEVSAPLLRRIDHAEGLATFVLDLPVHHVPGQFVNVALEVGGERVARSYSLASAPGQPAEFLVTRVEGGRLTPALFTLQPGDAAWIDPTPQGHFTLRRVPEVPDLWLVATGTGLAPYLSMARSGELGRFERVVWVHGVRRPEHLVHRDWIAARWTHVPVVSRAPGWGGLEGRIPALLQSGALEAAAGAAIDPERSHVMLCGNPGMIAEVRALLEARGLVRNRPRRPGHYTIEAYW